MHASYILLSQRPDLWGDKAHLKIETCKCVNMNGVEYGGVVEWNMVEWWNGIWWNGIWWNSLDETPSPWFIFGNMGYLLFSYFCHATWHAFLFLLLFAMLFGMLFFFSYFCHASLACFSFLHSPCLYQEYFEREIIKYGAFIFLDGWWKMFANSQCRNCKWEVVCVRGSRSLRIWKLHSKVTTIWQSSLR